MGHRIHVSPDIMSSNIQYHSRFLGDRKCNR